MTTKHDRELAELHARRHVAYSYAWYKSGDDELLDAATEAWNDGCSLVGRAAFQQLLTKQPQPTVIPAGTITQCLDGTEVYIDRTIVFS